MEAQAKMETGRTVACMNLQNVERATISRNRTATGVASAINQPALPHACATSRRRLERRPRGREDRFEGGRTATPDRSPRIHAPTRCGIAHGYYAFTAKC